MLLRPRVPCPGTSSLWSSMVTTTTVPEVCTYTGEVGPPDVDCQTTVEVGPNPFRIILSNSITSTHCSS